MDLKTHQNCTPLLIEYSILGFIGSFWEYFQCIKAKAKYLAEIRVKKKLHVTGAFHIF